MSAAADELEALLDREANGEPLDQAERRALDRACASDPAMAAERRLWRDAGDLLEGLPMQHDGMAALVESAIEASEAPPRVAGTAGRRVALGVTAAALAVAAAALVWVVRPGATLSLELTTPAAVSHSSGAAIITKSADAPGDAIAVEVSFGDGGGCVRTPSEIELCGDPGARVRVDARAAISGPTEVFVHNGTLGASARRDQGTPLAVHTADTTLQVTTTVYDFTVAAARFDTPATAVVVEGGLSWRVGDETRQLGANDRAQIVDHRIVVEHPGAATREPAPPEEAGPARPGRPRRGRADAALSAQALVDRAHAELAARRWSDAADTYAELLAAHPRSPQARTALVRLGDLQLRHQGDARSALATYERYLERGGPLEREATLGRIRALAKLGKSSQEAAAIRQWLARYPDGLQAEAMRERLHTLAAGGASP